MVKEGGHLAETASGHESVEVLEGLLHANDHQAAHNREHFDRHGVLAVNLMSSPGAGKTSLLEATIEATGDEFRYAVIEGDLETENDAQRIRDKGTRAIQISTGSACHLDLDDYDIVFIENVGNLVCPASFDLGHHANVTLLSTPEGDDKPAKYPVMFRASDLVLISKADLLPVLDDFDPDAAATAVRQLANDAPLIEISSKSGQGLDAWLDWLRAMKRGRVATPVAETHTHSHATG